MANQLIRHAFSAGQWDPKYDGRSNTERYPMACSSLRNMQIHLSGGVSTRPGTIYVGEALGPCRLFEFRYNAVTAYVLEFSELVMRIWGRDGLLDDDGSPIEVTTPYAYSDLARLQIVQSFDTLFCFHPDHFPRKIVRDSDTSWTIGELDVKDGPWLDENITDITLTPSATTGEGIDLEASESLFVEGHVGSLFRIRHPGVSTDAVIVAQNSFTSELTLYGKLEVGLVVVEAFDGKITLQKSYDGGTTWFDVAGFYGSSRQSFFEDRIGVTYRLGCKTGDYRAGYITCYLSQPDCYGVVKITAVTDDENAECDVIAKLGGTSATTVWHEGAWNSYRGFPATGSFHEDRLWLGGTLYDSTRIWGSWSGEYDKFLPGDTAASAQNLSISAIDSPIQWMASLTGFLLGTLGEEAWLQSGSKPISGENPPLVKPQGSDGSALGLRPIKAGSRVIYVQQHRRQLVERNYVDSSDSYEGTDLSLFASRLVSAGIKEIAFANRPIPMVLCVLYDGTMAVLTYYSVEKVAGWSHWETTGEIESIAVIPSDPGGSVGHSEIWISVNRENGRYIERFATNEYAEDPQDYVCVDSCVSGTTISMTALSGLDHLEGETVSVLADGADAGSYPVLAGGKINLVLPVGTAYTVGLPYDYHVETMRLELGPGPQTVQRRIKRFLKLTTRFLETMPGDVGPWYASKHDGTSKRIPLDDFTGSERTVDVDVQWDLGYDKDCHVCIGGASPCHMHLVCLFMDVETE